MINDQDDLQSKEWHTLGAEDLLELIQNLSSGTGVWTWTRNSRCKYVSMKFDMRDGAFILLDRDGKRIEASDLINQHKDENE